jgi:hypothetical protein
MSNFSDSTYDNIDYSKDNNKNFKDNSIYKYFSTKKNISYKPDLIINFTSNYNSEICLLGFPFYLLEYAEIM